MTSVISDPFALPSSPIASRAKSNAVHSAAGRQCRAGLGELAARRLPHIGVRRIRPADRDAVLAMHERCSLATRRCRWMAPSPIFPHRYLQSLLAGSAEHVAVVAVCDGRPASVIGLASAALTSDGCRELGFLVEDNYQARGIGTSMLDLLVDLVEPNEDLCASVMSENGWVLTKLARFGTVTTCYDQGVSHARIT